MWYVDFFWHMGLLGRLEYTVVVETFVAALRILVLVFREWRLTSQLRFASWQMLDKKVGMIFLFSLLMIGVTWYY